MGKKKKRRTTKKVSTKVPARFETFGCSAPPLIYYLFLVSMYRFVSDPLEHNVDNKHSIPHTMMNSTAVPPTCALTPPCGPQIGLKCNVPDSCYLTIHQFYCCEGLFSKREKEERGGEKRGEHAEGVTERRER